MKNKALFIISIVIISVIGYVIASKLFINPIASTMPFKELKVQDVQEMTVQLLPPGTEIDLNTEEVADVVNILNDVVTYKKDNTYRESVGQAVIFTITKADGTQLSINAYNPYIIINDIGYKTKYEPCEELNQYANMLLEKSNN